jgi:DNA-binding HxlR family transcriptional regulator
VGGEEHPGGCCPQYHLAVELIGKRWTGAIVAVLLSEGPQRFGGLTTAVPGLSDRVLSQRLRELEAEELVARTVHPGPPLRVEYALTPKGVALEPVVRALEQWGQRWMSCEEPRVTAAASASAGVPQADVGTLG